MSWQKGSGPQPGVADLGDFIVVLLAGTLAGLRDRLYDEGYPVAGDLLTDLIEVVDGYLAQVPTEPSPTSRVVAETRLSRLICQLRPLRPCPLTRSPPRAT